MKGIIFCCLFGTLMGIIVLVFSSVITGTSEEAEAFRYAFLHYPKLMVFTAIIVNILYTVAVFLLSLFGAEIIYEGLKK